MKALDPVRTQTGSDDDHMVLPSVLCPWGCSEFPFRTASLNPALLLQHHLAKVQLNLPSALVAQLHTVESSRLDYIRKPHEPPDYVLLNKKWPTRSSVCMTWKGVTMIIWCCQMYCVRGVVASFLFIQPPLIQHCCYSII